MAYNRNNFKIRFRPNPQYFINEKKGIVTCKMHGLLQTPVEANLWANPKVCSTDVDGVGVAKCHADDAFDINVGKKIARARAENECYLAAKRYLIKERSKILSLLHEANLFIDKSYRCCAHNDDYIDSLTIPAHPNYKHNK